MEQGQRAELRRGMERLAGGDRSAFGPVFALLWPEVRRFAVRLCGAADGEDAAQAALLQIFSRAAEYDPARDALAWALGLTAWECRTLRRKALRRRESAPPAADPRVDERAAESVDERAAQGNPEQALLERELRDLAREVLGSLRPLDTETLLVAAAGRKVAHGATFRKRLERALARFKLAWRARHGED